MKIVVWAGPCTPMAQPLKDFLESSPAREKSYLLSRKPSSRVDPFLIVSQDPDLLAQSTNEHPTSLQILICTAADFLPIFESGLRVLNRYFYILDQQTINDFSHLFNKLLKRMAPARKNSIGFGSLPSMQNSLEVLRRITEDRIFELKNFAIQEDERRKHFRSLIQLARTLSMSRDIEEVVQCLWNDLRHVDAFKGLTLICGGDNGHYYRILSKNGKFHFSELPSLKNEIELFHQLMTNHRLAGLIRLNEQDTLTLGQWIKRPLQHPFACVLSSESSENTFFLMIETDGLWKASSTFRQYLQERLSFISLSLDKHMLQQRIKEKAQLWATTFNDLQDPIAVIDQNRNVHRSNLKFQTFKGSHCHTVFANSPMNCNGCPSTIESARSFQLQVSGKIYQARLFPIENSAHEHPRHFVAHYVDTTNESLLYGQLIQSEKMIAVGRLAGDLSDALSQPLRKIGQTAVRALSTRNLSPALQNDLEEIRKASQRSLNIIADFENFSHGHMEKVPILAETVVERTIPLVKALLHGVRFHLQLSEQKHSIVASLSLLQQVLYNLLKNAKQAINGQGEIRISTQSHSLNERTGVLISVTDSGPGVPENLRERIFQPFFTSKSSGEGTGLGLNIVKQIVEGHNGQVGFISPAAGGSTFWIWLPLQNQIPTDARRQDHGNT